MRSKEDYFYQARIQGALKQANRSYGKRKSNIFSKIWSMNFLALFFLNWFRCVTKCDFDKNHKDFHCMKYQTYIEKDAEKLESEEADKKLLESQDGKP